MNRTPDSQAMFAATTKKSFLLTDIADTCDVLEEAVNIAFEGGPGPVHIHVPENLTHHGVEVENYRDIRLDVAPVLPDPAGSRRSRRCWRTRSSGRSRSSRWSGSERSAAGPAPRSSASSSGSRSRC